ncbi:DUF4145 domain-containing protein [Georgenia sp. SUBG003]|uniref:DUF4145 domain-containing protein n=1 Tax=Georgenia sp. SUBG003 TaxID=1497974 RepID=UPI003AB12AC3
MAYAGAANFDDESVPAPVVKAYDEGVRCLSIQVPNAAAAMLRSALAQVVQDKGSEAARDKKTLNDAIKQMVSEQTLPPVFKDWAEHIKNMGNAGAHPEILVQSPWRRRRICELSSCNCFGSSTSSQPPLRRHGKGDPASRRRRPQRQAFRRSTTAEHNLAGTVGVAYGGRHHCGRGGPIRVVPGRTKRP